ncbi:MAG: Gfo/Idh/MocA family protein [Thermoguttaceae bacterium]
MNRRNFLKQTTFVGVTLASAAIASPLFIPRSVLAQNGRPGANDRIGVAGIGVGRQGGGVFAAVLRDKRTQGICVCDVWKKRAEEVAKKHEISEFCQDYRQVIDNEKVDAIITATPEQWRSLICVNAALAGKHLYVEKPVTFTIEDGKLMRAATRKSGIKFQCGSMQRSMPKNFLACQFIREGHIGAVKEIHAANYETPWKYNFSGETVPEGLDWNQWCGPAPLIPFHPEIFIPRGNPGWLTSIDHSGGEMTGWGTHGFDQIHCAMGLNETGPVEIFVEGEKLDIPVYDKPEPRQRGHKLCSKPNLSFRYENGLTVKMLDKPIGRGGAIFLGEKGNVTIDRDKMISDPPELAENWLKEHSDFRLPSHETDWINCIYSGETPIGEMETGIRTASLCHILNIARYLGRNLKWNPESEEFVGDAEANTWLSREHRKGFEQAKIV